MLNLERLRVLHAVAVHGSVAGAAAALHVTPSGVSQQLAKLERESGHRLLEPHGRTVRLTHAGRTLAGYAARVVAEAAAAESDLADLSADIIGPLRLGGVGSSLRALLPDVLAELTRAHPRLVPTLVDGEAVGMVPLLARGDLDLLLVESWANRPLALPAGLATRTLAVEDVHLALGEGHPLADRECVDLGDLDGQVWATCPAGTEPYEALVQALRAVGREPEIRYTVTEFATQLALVARNLAVALFPEMGQSPAPPGVRFVPVRPRMRREVLAAWRAPGLAGRRPPPLPAARDGGARCLPRQTASPAVRACVDALSRVEWSSPGASRGDA
ncbi:DNA-binding transcriptional regulator, LysR family [Streptomyces sp. WMMB 714]|uniref:LysR family transcriptional regulator n=1 Tax=Streptomyces sp. WMMB 714 TaxID=1286822 RepID=UPI0005F89278|nr:LysR family transcriptional regulator [Streptomyces sp. WMMB 714]SCK20404.1 DNA-binding transcriptional regulator, LysR family [Streptomyces sp. WMMB 714]